LNAGGVPKDTAVNFNRFIPQAPADAGLEGGVDTRISGQPAASINWLPVTGNDILGYTVYRANATGVPLLGSDTPVCSTASVSSTNCFDAPGPAPNDLASFATHAACPPTAGLLDKCINYYVVPFDQKWAANNPLLLDATTCLPFPYVTGITAPTPPTSVAPLTNSSGWSTARAGCPSALFNINYTVASANPQPAQPDTPTTCHTDTGQPVIGWTPPSNPGNLVSYRIYRDPPSTPKPGYNDPSTTINFGTPTPVSSFKDPQPTGGADHTYYVTVVDDKFQESNPLQITWTAATCP
jgi:hypothetical protein